MMKSLLNRNLLMTVVLMLMVTVSLSSCETLRKKFTRHKKEGDQIKEEDAVLEPQDYPAPEHNPPEIYKQHYALIKSWYKDLWGGISERGTDGTVRYAIKQIVDQLELMKVLLKPEKAMGIDKLENLLMFYKTSLDQPRNVRNYSRIQSDLRQFDRELRGEYRFDVVKGDLAG
jgi:hypothetical protein